MNRTFLATALLAAFISGCSTPETPTKKGPPSKATGNVTPPSGKSLNGENQMPISQDDSVIGFLQELFDVHDLKAKRQGEWLTFAKSSIRVSGAIVKETPRESSFNCQLDVRVETDDGLYLIESFAGFGSDRQSAIKDSLENFTRNSFHVILRAFLVDQDDQVTVEDWQIGNSTHRVILGNINGRGRHPGGLPPGEWFGVFEQELKRHDLKPGTHWVRVYYAHLKGRNLEMEVLLDNNSWREMESKLASVEWPKSQDFYSVRLFLIIRDK